MNATTAKSRAIYLTIDTDWCAEEVLEFTLALFRDRDLPCTVFTTGYYAALCNPEARSLEIGWHPNFNETAPEKYQDKLKALQQLYPQAAGVSSHAMTSNTPLLQIFRQFGLRYDRNLLRYKDAQAQPFVYHNGLLRLPIFWEDDIWFTLEPGARFSPNLFAREHFRLIFNFHPIHLYLNTVSMEHYQAFKPYQQEPEKLAPYRRSGYGALSFFEEVAAHIQRENLAAGLLRDFLPA